MPQTSGLPDTLDDATFAAATGRTGAPTSGGLPGALPDTLPDELPATLDEALKQTGTPQWKDLSPDQQQALVALRQRDRAAQEQARVPAPGILPPSVSNFFGGYLSNLNPLPMLEGLYSDYTRRQAENQAAGRTIPGVGSFPISAGQTLLDLQRGILGAQTAQASQAVDLARQGRYSEAFGHGVAAVTPLVGPAAAHAGERIGSGDISGGMGEGLALLTPEALRYLPEIRPGVRVPAIPGFRSTLNPVEQSAVSFGERAGIPMDVATRSGGSVARGTQHVLSKSVGSSGVAREARLAGEAALTRTGEGLVQSVEPGLGTQAISQESAGQGIQDALQSKIDRYHQNANAAYDQLRRIEADPANTQRIQVGTQQQAVTTPGRGVTGVRTVPVMKDIAMPVDMRPFKAAIEPVYDRMLQTIPLTQQQASPGLAAMRNLLQGDDFLPATTVEQNLGTLKGVARTDTGLRDVSQGLAARQIGVLDRAVQDAVAQAGPDAVQALNRGRALTRAKYQTADLLGTLRKEPVQLFNQLTARQDTSIDLLRDVQKTAPQEMPRLGRAYLQGLLDTATAEGGFQKAGTLQNAWQKLGPETKRLLFRDPQTIQNLDDFFLLAKKISENPNPSGTATTIASAMPILRPFLAFSLGGLKGMALEAAGEAIRAGANYGLARALFNNDSARAIVNGMWVSLRKPANIAASVTGGAALAGAAGKVPIEPPPSPPPGAAAVQSQPTRQPAP